MISLNVLFWMYVILFAFIGALRGWARESVVLAGVIVAIFVINILENFVPFIRDALKPEARFWVRFAVLIILTFFGYQGPNLTRLAQSGKFVRDKLQDILLGIFLGAVNGYMFFGTAWYYLNDANYFFEWISPPDLVTDAGQKALRLLEMLPPQWLDEPVIYIAVALAFIFILVVFI